MNLPRLLKIARLREASDLKAVSQVATKMRSSKLPRIMVLESTITTMTWVLRSKDCRLSLKAGSVWTQ
jgi:hypothetical protein